MTQEKTARDVRFETDAVSKNSDLLKKNGEIWQGWKDSNLRIPESKSGALTAWRHPCHFFIGPL